MAASNRLRHRLRMAPILGLLVVVWTPILYNTLPRSLNPVLLAPVLSPVLLSLLVLWFFAVVESSDDGLRLFRGPLVPWAEIRGLRRRMIMALPFVILYRADRSPLWLPLFVHNRMELEQRLEDHWQWLQRTGQGSSN